MRLIDADALKPLLREYCVDGDEVVAKWYDIMGIDEVVDRAPTVDAVPVVWCKDCKWWTKQEKSIQGRCALNGTYPTGGWYCANGERKDDESNGD